MLYCFCPNASSQGLSHFDKYQIENKPKSNPMQSLPLTSNVQSSPKNKCLKCGLVNFADDTSCKRCGNEFGEPSPSADAKQNRSQYVPPHFANHQPATNFNQNVSFELTPRLLLSVVGSVLLFVGVFMPLVSVPILGNMNYFQNGKGDGVVIIILTGVSLFLALTERFKGLLITGILSLAMLAFTFFGFQWKMSQARAEMGKSDNLFKGFGEKMLETVQLQWGWAILIVGAGMLIAAALIKSHQNDDDSEIVVERNNTSLYAVLAVAGIALTGWVCLAVVPQFNDGTNSIFGGNSISSSKDMAAKEKSETDANFAKQREPLLNALSVNLVSKNFTARDFYAGRPSDNLSFTVQQMNKSAKDIRGYKGTFAIKDIFGDELIKISYKSDEVLRAGQSKKEEMGLSYNQFMDSHKKLRSTAMDNLRIEWQPEMIMFADGTALGLNGEQAHSIENKLPENQTDTTIKPSSEPETQTTNETTVSERKPHIQKPVQKKRLVVESSDAGETADKTAEADEPVKSRVFDNFDTEPKVKTKPSSTPPKVDTKSPMVIRMPDGRMKIVNQ
jgi:hypothetical protein